MDFWSLKEIQNLRWSIQGGRYLAVTYLTCYGAPPSVTVMALDNILAVEIITVSIRSCWTILYCKPRWRHCLKTSKFNFFSFIISRGCSSQLSVKTNFAFALFLLYYFKTMSLFFCSKEKRIVSYLFRKACELLSIIIFIANQQLRTDCT